MRGRAPQSGASDCGAEASKSRPDGAPPTQAGACLQPSTAFRDGKTGDVCGAAHADQTGQPPAQRPSGVGKNAVAVHDEQNRLHVLGQASTRKQLPHLRIPRVARF
jgi:hypothetical protein